MPRPRGTRGQYLGQRMGVVGLAGQPLRLEVTHQPGEAALVRDPHSRRDGIDEQPDHAVNAGDRGRTARYHSAEHHVVSAIVAGEHQPPERLECRTQRRPFPRGQLAQGGGRRGIDFKGHLLQIIRAAKFRRFQPGQRGERAIFFQDGSPVLRGFGGLPVQPAQVIGQGWRRRQVLPALKQVQPVPVDDAETPPVEHDMVEAPDDPVAAVGTCRRSRVHSNPVGRLIPNRELCK